MDADSIIKFITAVGLPTTVSLGLAAALVFERKQNIALQKELINVSNGMAATMARMDSVLSVMTTRKSRS